MSNEGEPFSKQKQPDIRIFHPGLTLFGYLEKGLILNDEQINTISLKVGLLVGKLISEYIERGEIPTATTKDLPPPSNTVG